MAKRQESKKDVMYSVVLEQFCSTPENCCKHTQTVQVPFDVYNGLRSNVLPALLSSPIRIRVLPCLKKDAMKNILSKTDKYIASAVERPNFRQGFLFKAETRSISRIATPQDIAEWERSQLDKPKP